jgi:hypothetical protein
MAKGYSRIQTASKTTGHRRAHTSTSANNGAMHPARAGKGATAALAATMRSEDSLPARVSMRRGCARRRITAALEKRVACCQH